MNGFEDKHSSGPQLSTLSTEQEDYSSLEGNPYLEAYPITENDTKEMKAAKEYFAKMLKKHDENKYYGFTPGGNEKMERIEF